jgi:M6 family metalloprotease-like protein
MRRLTARFPLTLVYLPLVGLAFATADPPKPDRAPQGADLADYRTAETAVPAPVRVASPSGAGLVGYLGVTLAPGSGRLVVGEVQPDSPAARAGVKPGDLVAQVGGRTVTRAEVFQALVQSHAPGEALPLTLQRDGKPVEVTATLTAVSRPMRRDVPPVVLGAALGEVKDGLGLVERIMPGSPAATAGLKEGDKVLKIDGTRLTRATQLSEVLSAKKPGDTLSLALQRDGREVELKVALTAERGRFGFRDSGPAPPWTKDVYRLAVVGVEFADVKHNPKIPAKEWDQALYSTGAYTKTNATGQPVFGSLNDYYREQSCGKFRVEGKVFDWVQASKKRADYAEGSGTGFGSRSNLLSEALDLLEKRDGKDALKGFDGLFFVYAGERIVTNRGGLYYPHSGVVMHQNKRWPYLLSYEGGGKMAPLNAYCKEFGFLLGLPDLAARPENPGSEGCGVWCLMSDPVTDGRPQHLCAWAKEKLGWVKPTVIDPTVKQKLVLGPVEGSPRECFKVLARPDGSEYFLLENRRKKGFDADLPAEGLLIWRVVKDRPVLEESHGVEGSAGPRVFLDLVPYPSPSNNAFTPQTSPSSRSPLGGGLPVHVTEIRRLPDGRIAFHVGYEYQ